MWNRSEPVEKIKRTSLLPLPNRYSVVPSLSLSRYTNRSPRHLIITLLRRELIPMLSYVFDVFVSPSDYKLDS